MIPYVRREKILAELKIKKLVYIEDLIKIFNNISRSTIRRDLKALEVEGYVDLLQGGAAKLCSGSYDMPIQSKKRLHMGEKNRIAKYAASLVKDGEVIYIDSGTTTLQMVKYLKGKKIKAITSNTQIINEFQDGDFNCIFLGGEISSLLGSVKGPIAERLLSELFFDKAFLGASGYTLESGINTPDLSEVNKKRIVKKHSKETYILVDSSKANKQTSCKCFDIDECIIITDESNEILEKYAKFIVVPNEATQK
jgi:DeoR family transcriptional regulator, fructose operon transcriptional repressor